MFNTYSKNDMLAMTVRELMPYLREVPRISPLNHIEKYLEIIR